MYGFPIGNGNAGFNDFVEKFTNNADSGFPNIQQREVFYSIKDGNWNDTSVWQTSDGRVGLLPTQFDDVYIRHNITNNITNAIINNLFVTGNFISGNSSQISILGNINAIGSISLTGTSSVLYLYGLNNYINPNLFSTNASASIAYYKNELSINTPSQPILNLNYANLTIGGTGIKYLISDLTISGNLTIQNINSSLPTFELSGYTLTVNGTTTIGTIDSTKATLSQSGSGNILFVGLVTLRGSNPLPMSLLGNPNVEFRGGLTSANSNAPGTENAFGTGTFSFTTNNQNLNISSGGQTFSCNIVISNNITLTIAGTGFVNLRNTINGLGANSKLTLGLNSNLNFTTLESVPSMTTGIWDFTTNANTIYYSGNYSATIPSYFTTFHNLNIQGSGTKTLSTNTILNGNLSITARGYLECSTFNLTINGTTGINESGTCTTTGISKNGAGNIIFVGALSTGGGGCGNSNTLNFSGNPNVEFRNGGTINGLTLVSGTGTYKFSTNNQSIGFASNTINGPIVIEGNITLTLAGLNRINNSINGTTASSTLNNTGSLYFTNPAYLTAMSTGIFTFNVSSTSVIGYEFNGDATIPYGSFQGLYITGTGTKSASQNIICNQALTISAGTLQLGIYDLTCNSTSTITSASTLKKSGAGNILFVGVMSNGGGSLNSFDLGGNPNVEFRSANTWNTTGFSGSGSGTGQWKFTATGTIFASTAIPFTCSILVSGNIVLSTSNTTIFNGVINGDTSTSTFRVGSSHTITYNNATQPMATGVLDTSTNLNTWIYGSGNQDIRGASPKQVYRNLTLNGGGTKTLQGFVGVQNTYTLTFPATLALNGYTLTNP